jgi:hypothetical protein
MWQIWLALRAWGLRPSTPRLQGPSCSLSWYASQGLRPHTPRAFGSCGRVEGKHATAQNHSAEQMTHPNVHRVQGSVVMGSLLTTIIAIFIIVSTGQLANTLAADPPGGRVDLVLDEPSGPRNDRSP